MLCLQASLLAAPEAALLLHTNIVDLSSLGPHWRQLYSQPGLRLTARLRVTMARDPTELNILGSSGVSEQANSSVQTST